jgi:hypothetical protein
VPESRNYEQYINAHFVRQMNAGDWCRPADLTTSRLAGFMARADQFQCNVSAERMNGLPEALEVIRRHLPSHTVASRQRQPVLA